MPLCKYTFLPLGMKFLTFHLIFLMNTERGRGLSVFCQEALSQCAVYANDHDVCNSEGRLNKTPRKTTLSPKFNLSLFPKMWIREI